MRSSTQEAPVVFRLSSSLALVVALAVATGCGKKDTPPAAPDAAAVVEADTATAPEEADTATAPEEADTATAPEEADTATAPEEADTAASPDDEADTATAANDEARIETVDLTQLTPPLTLGARVTREPVPADAPFDCSSGTLWIDVEDAGGTRRSLKVGAVTGMASEDPPRETKVGPNERGAYEDLGVFCAGLQSGWRVAREGDTLMATDVWSDESTGEGQKAWILATLPPGGALNMQ